MGWPARDSDDGSLVRNGNGSIDNASELLGNFTPQPPSAHRNGYAALAEFDKRQNGGNANGAIDAGDAIFKSLRIWIDHNHNGISEPDELHTLDSVGSLEIDLNCKETKWADAFGNAFRHRAKLKSSKSSHVGHWTCDVFLAVAPNKP